MYMSSTIIGEGSYGCVMKPSLPCKNKTISYKNKISKWMLTDSAIKEIQEYALVGNADTKEEFSTGKPISCSLKENTMTWKAISKCRLMNNKFKNKTMKQVGAETALLIINDGGLDLEKWAKTIKKRDEKGKINDFWRETERLFRGIKLFQEHDLVHHDIKPQNIVYMEKNRRVNYIDFGLMRSLKTEGAKCRDINRCNANPHWNYPTDIFLMDRKLFNELQKKTVEQRRATFDAYIDNLKTQKDTKFVAAFNTMIKYIGVSQEDKNRFYQRHMAEFRDLLINPGSFDTYLEKALTGFDVFGLGFTLLYVLGRVKLQMEVRTVQAMENLFLKMMTPNVYKRLTISQALTEYKKIISQL
jgi:serine/threonine protein kinase